jgi:ABC-type lipopolysaccharide export system ATPase subunit
MTQQEVKARAALRLAYVVRDQSIVRRDDAEAALHAAMRHVIKCEDELRKVQQEDAQAAFAAN